MRRNFLHFCLLALLILLLTSTDATVYSQTTNPTPSFLPVGGSLTNSTSADSANFFGLAIGNTWFYRAGSTWSAGRLFGLRAEIIDTLTDGIRVVKVDSLFLDRRGTGTTYWYHDRQGKLYLLKGASLSYIDYPEYDASLQRDTSMGSPYIYGWYYRYHLLDSVILGTRLPAQEVSRSTYGKVYTWHETYLTAPGLAFVAYRGSGTGVSSGVDSLELVGVVKTGIVTGDTTLTADSLKVAHAPSPLTSTITANPTTVPIDGITPSVITIQTKDFAGHLLTTGGADVRIAIYSISGSPWTNLSNLTDHNDGTYSCTLTASLNPGTVTLWGVIGSSPTVSKCTVTFVNTPVRTASLEFSTLSASPGEIAADGTSTSHIRAQLKDAVNSDFSQSGGTLAMATTLGSLGPVTDNSDGTYQATLTSSIVEGLAVISGTLNGAAFTDTATVNFVTEQEIPTNYVLEQNHSNPFNASTIIRYGLPRDVHVTLSVYDMLGREVVVLTDAAMEAGYHSATFDGRNLASGTYYYRLEAGEFTKTGKMVLLK